MSLPAAFLDGLEALKLKSVNDSTAIITARNARDSPLLRLPAELRKAIYSMVIGGHVIVICGYKKRCPMCWAKDESHRTHCPGDVVAITKTCRQIHTETSLMPLKMNTFCGHVDDLDFMLNECFCTQTELEAIESIWVKGGIKYFRWVLGQLGGLKEVMVSADTVWHKSDEEQEQTERVLVSEMKRELRTLEGQASHAKVRVLGTKEQYEMPALACALKKR